MGYILILLIFGSLGVSMNNDFIRLDEEKKVVLYTRSLKQGVTYYARFKLDRPELANNQPYVRESMKTPSLDIATTRALERAAELKILQDNDMVVRGKTVEQGISAFVDEYEQRLGENWDGYSIYMLRHYRKHCQKYWVPYIGAKKLALVKESDFRDYEKWRRSYWKNNKPNHGNIKLTPAPTTIQHEINSMKSVMRWCRENGYYSGMPITFHKKNVERNPRSAFTLEQYHRIIQYLRTNEWLSVGKHGTDSRIIRHRRMLREWFLFACNIGMRIGEMREIKWRDVSFDKTESGKRYVRVKVGKNTKVGKYGKSRERIGRHYAARSLERMREWREDNLKSNDYVFCSPDGNTLQDIREGFNALLKEASMWQPRNGGEPIDCEHDTDGRKMTPYCCRHTYITFQLRFRKQPDVYAIAENTATSIAMIQQYYSDAKPEDFVERVI